MTEIDKVNEWLTTKRAALWGQGWMITSDDSRQDAAEWFARQVDEYTSYVLKMALRLHPARCMCEVCEP